MMKDILQQIQSLKEDFMNLIEVETPLGQSASDVPPSINKVKRNVKTKNGKAELVSVEDELFPSDGNKREQYRQKIIDTINGMIQGTSTLDDLLQIVRQKKMPVKEGLEKAADVLEELILERNKENKAKKEKWELKTNGITKKYKKDIQDYAKEQGDEAKFHQAAANDYDHIYSQQPAMAPNGTPNSVAAYFNDKYREMLRNKGRNKQNIADKVEPLTNKLKNRKHIFHDMVRGYTESESFASEHRKSLKKAVGIVEAIINELSPETVSRALDKRIDKSIEADDKEREEFNNILKIEDRDERSKAYKDFKKRSDARTKQENKKLDLYFNYYRRHNPNPPLEEAMGVLEAIINEVPDKWVEGKRENYKIKRDKAIIRHAQTMTDENPEGDKELLKDRQSKIDRLNKFDEKNKRYKELKREGKIKPCKNSKEDIDE